MSSLLDAKPTAKCDFCSSLEPAWVYPAGNFDVAELQWGSSGGWTACEACAALIEKGDHDRLVRERMMGGAMPAAFSDMGITSIKLTKSERRLIEAQTRRLLTRFLATRRGERRLFG